MEHTDNTTVSTTFVSPTNELRLVKKPARRKPIGEGGDWENVPGEYLVFRDGRLVITDQDDLEWLREHDNYGRLFHELGNEPDRPGEDTAALHGQIINLAFNGDYDRIGDILVAERSSLSRPDVIAACEAALQRAGLSSPDLPEAPEHELERVRLAGGQPSVEAAVPAEPTPRGTPAATSPPPEAPEGERPGQTPGV